MVMIIHRAMRDIARCRRKYGDAWAQYEKEVPYLFIPVSRNLISNTGLKLTNLKVYHLNGFH